MDITIIDLYCCYPRFLHSLGATIPLVGLLGTGAKLKGKGEDLNQVRNVVSTEKMESIYTPIYRDVVNSPLGATQQRLDLSSTTHYQLGVPSAHTFNPPFVKTDILPDVKSGDVRAEVKNGDAGASGAGKEGQKSESNETLLKGEVVYGEHYDEAMELYKAKPDKSCRIYYCTR